MYTLGIFNVKIYICNSRRLMPLIQRSSKTISLRPVLQRAVKKYADANDQTNHLYGREFADKFGDTQQSALAPGPHLDKVNLRMGEQLIVDLERLLNIQNGTSKTIKLYKWVQDTVVEATSSGIYGANHPFRDPAVKDAFW